MTNGEFKELVGAVIATCTASEAVALREKILAVLSERSPDLVSRILVEGNVPNQKDQLTDCASPVVRPDQREPTPHQICS